MHHFYGLYDEATPFSIETYVGSVRYGIPTSMIPVGDDGTGNFICMGIASQNFGHIFFLDHEKHPFDSPDSRIGITLLANSFTAFRSTCKWSPHHKHSLL